MTRIAFYSHDTFGLGHLRRCLKLIRALNRSLPESEGVLITGSPWARLFECPAGFRIEPLPPVVKRGNEYRPLVEGWNLEEVLELRSQRLQSLLLELRPDLLIIDNVPCGLRGEMRSALQRLRQIGSTRVVLVLRDVLDAPERIHWEWSKVGAGEALAHLYDEVWVFGDETDARQMGNLPGMRQVDVRVCGRLGIDASDPVCGTDSSSRVGESSDGSRPISLLVSGGGGGDALPVVQTFVDMLGSVRAPVESRIVLGPDFPEIASTSLWRAKANGARVERFVRDLPALMRQADVVVAMAGYNTVCEIEALGKRSVLIPRVWPRQEQWIRARRLEREGRAQVIHPHQLSPEVLWQSIRASLAGGAPTARRHLGAEKAAEFALSLIGSNIAANLGRAVAS